VPERPNGAVLKTADRRKAVRGFKSHPRRSVSHKRPISSGFATRARIQCLEQAHKFARDNGLESADARAVIPGPSSFREFLELLLTAATDETVRSEPHTEQLVDSGIYGRRDENGGDIGGATYDTRIIGSRTLETRRRLDQRDILFRAVPDLRSIVLALQLS
jgi:hypothetical protein